tara:strand:+ start:626 stop:799 length:174 start_codon:yes stop_codon:yes gene_type:complete
MGYQKDFCCSECKKDNIQFQVWADENNIVKNGDEDCDEVWCEDCNEHTKCELKTNDN